MNTWKIILATVVIFGAGVITGGLLVSHSDRAKLRQLRAQLAVQPGHWAPPLREFPRRPESELQRSFEQRRMEFVLNATRELKLTPEQRARIELLIHESQERVRRVWEEIRPQMRKELVDATERVRQELTPPQRKRFEELMKRQQVRRVEETAPPARPPREGRRPGPLREAAPQSSQPGPLEPNAGQTLRGPNGTNRY